MNAHLCNCTRPLSLLSVIYNEIDDNRGGWKEKNNEYKRTGENGGRCCHVDALSVESALGASG